ncbi:MAG: lamin tail domain-containing protein [Bacteroidota bacterium]
MKQIICSVYLFLLLYTPLLAQITDNFTDGNYTNNPVWAGDAVEFTINPSNQLQLNNTIASASYLSTASASSSLNNMEWRFYIKQSFAPSSSNYGRVYLASNQANLEGSLNGYYLQFGEAGSLDAVELFRQTGITNTSVARGTDGQIAGSFALGIKVTRNTSGTWNIYIDAVGGTAYALQASGADNTYATTNYFGVSTVYTAGNSTKFYFDDFYNGALVIDATPPTIVSSTVISNTQLDILFSESVSLNSSQTLTNYSANNSLGTPSTAVRDAINLSLVHITFATPFTNALSNILTITNVQDLNANTIAAASTNFTYYLSLTTTFKDIIINEIFADPAPQVGLPAAEFIEIYNKTTGTINLNGWTLSDGTSTATLNSYTLFANQFLIIHNILDSALFTSYANTMGVSGFPSLNNTGDNIYLKNNSLVFIDSVNYSDAWYKDAVKKAGGWTMELINPGVNVNCPESGNWIASNNTAGGTPGLQNSVYSSLPDIISPSVSSITIIDSMHIDVCFSEALDPSLISSLANYTINNGIGTPVADTVNNTFSCVYLTLSNPLISATTYSLTLFNLSDCSGNLLTPAAINFSAYRVKLFDVTINEIMPDPDPVHTTLPNYEYIELYNKTAFPINLANWTYTSGTTIKLLPDVTILADSFLVITSIGALPEFPSNIAITGLTSLPLPNSGQTLTLKNAHGDIISSVSYTDEWYHDINKAAGGWSMEQIDPNNPCAGLNNWRASINSDGGTPGKRNSVNASFPDLLPPQTTRISVIAADTIQLFFNEPLDSTTMLNPLMYTIDNGVGAPTYVQPVAPDFKSVRLAVSTAFQTGIIYHVTVNSSITDCVGNIIGTNNSARFALPQPAIPNDIVINEILFNPKINGVDFVEIYNRSNKVIDLKTITLSQYDTVNNVLTNVEDITTDGYLLFPQEYLVLSQNTVSVKNQYTTSNPTGFLDMINLPAMGTTSGTVCLATATEIIDLFKYNENMQFALLNTTQGVSLERIDFERPTQERTNWHSAAASVGYATPGYKNSQYNNSRETASNTIEITPELFSPDEDGINDVVNINYNLDTPGFVANITIYDSKGRKIKHLVRNELLGLKGTYSWDGINDDREKERVGIYILFIELFDLSGNTQQHKKTCVLGGKL